MRAPCDMQSCPDSKDVAVTLERDIGALGDLQGLGGEMGSCLHGHLPKLRQVHMQARTYLSRIAAHWVEGAPSALDKIGLRT
jgi:hypothetical protein